MNVQHPVLPENSFASFMQIQIQAAVCCFLLLVTRFFYIFFNIPASDSTVSYTYLRERVLKQARETDLYRPGISRVCVATRPISLFTSDTSRLSARLNSADRILYIHGNNEPSTVRSPSWPQDKRSCNKRRASSLSLYSQGRTSLF